jgi:hypothetical protein
MFSLIAVILAQVVVTLGMTEITSTHFAGIPHVNAAMLNMREVILPAVRLRRSARPPGGHYRGAPGSC